MTVSNMTVSLDKPCSLAVRQHYCRVFESQIKDYTPGPTSGIWRSLTMGSQTYTFDVLKGYEELAHLQYLNSRDKVIRVLNGIKDAGTVVAVVALLAITYFGMIAAAVFAVGMVCIAATSYGVERIRERTDFIALQLAVQNVFLAQDVIHSGKDLSEAIVDATRFLNAKEIQELETRLLNPIDIIKKGIKAFKESFGMENQFSEVMIKFFQGDKSCNELRDAIKERASKNIDSIPVSEEDLTT